MSVRTSACYHEPLRLEYLGTVVAKKCFIAIVRGAKGRLLSFLNSNGLGSVYLSLHLLYETKDSDTKIFFSANFKCPKDPYHIPLEFEEGGRWEMETDILGVSEEELGSVRDFSDHSYTSGNSTRDYPCIQVTRYSTLVLHRKVGDILL